REHNSLEAILAQKPAPTAASDDRSDDEQEDTAAMLARLHQLSDQRKTLTELDRRIQDCQQLAQTYGNWASLIAVHRTGVLHRLLRSLALVFGLLLVVALADGGLRHAFVHAQDRRRGHQQRFLVRLTLRVGAAAAVLMIVFGPPSQTPTIIGLAGA